MVKEQLKQGIINLLLLLIKPVRPPSATPAEDSTNVVVVDVPKIAPADVAIASDIRAG